MLSIDITDNQIKVVEATGGKKVSVKKTETRDLPPGCIENGRIIDMHIVAGEITDVLVAERIKSRDAILCINSGMILYRELQIPKPKAANPTFIIESIIQNEMSLGDEYNITYSIIEQLKTDEGPKLKVIAAACPQKMIDTYVELARQIGLKIRLIVVSNSCITRLVRISAVYREVSPLLLLQIDRSFININIYDKGALIFSRFTQIDASDYENNPDYLNLAIFDNLFRTTHLMQQNETIEPLKEIQYFGLVKNEKTLHATIAQLNLEAMEFGFPADVIKKKNFNFLEYANTIGSFLSVDKKFENINLLNTKKRRIRSSNARFGIACVVVAVLCAAAVFAGTFFIDMINTEKKKTLSQLTADYQNRHFDIMREYVDEKKAAMTKFDTYADTVNLAKILFDFQPKMTSGIIEHLTREFLPEMAIEGELTVSGYSLSATFYCMNETDPALYTENLIEQGYFEDIQFNGYKQSGDRYTFSLSMRIKGGNIFEA